jgi:adenine-specific DNA-methyltransferase
VLCNPPYRKMTADECATYRDEYSDVIVGQPNLYSMFIRRATQLLKKGGRAVLLTPMSFLSGQSFSKVRETLWQEGTVSQFDLIHAKDGVFLGAEQDAVVTTWDKDRRRRATQVFNLSATSKPESAGRYQMISRVGPWPIPRQKGDGELLPLFNKELPRLHDYGYASKTGAIVIHRDKRTTFAKLKDSKRADCIAPLLWQGDIEANGKMEFVESDERPHRYVDVGSLDSPVVIKYPCLVYQRVTSADQPRRLVCAVVPPRLLEQFGGVVGENHVGFLTRASERAEVSPKLMSSILRTSTVDRLFRCISGVTNVSRSGCVIEDAVRLGYGLRVASTSNDQQKTKMREGNDGRNFDSRDAA